MSSAAPSITIREGEFRISDKAAERPDSPHFPDQAIVAGAPSMSDMYLN